VDTTTTTPAGPVAPAAPRRPKPHLQLVSWSRPAALRALRTAVILPLILVFTSKVVGNPQMATYATFGTFANLVLASFSGSRRNKFVAHLGLGVVGSALLTIGTLVSSSTPTAGVVTLVVTFVVLLAGVTGPNAAAGGLAAMLAYVLSAASPGVASMIPSRLEGWWLATAVAAVAVVATAPRGPGDQLRAAAAASARALAREIAATATDSSGPSLRADSAQAQERLRTLFNAAPYRPTGLATADQALGSLTELLEWVATMVGDTAAGHTMIGTLRHLDRELLLRSSAVLDAAAGILLGEDTDFDLDGLEDLRRKSAEAIRHSDGEGPDFVATVHASFHARTIAVAVRTAATDALIATHRASLLAVDRRRMGWLPGPAASGTGSSPAGTGHGATPPWAAAAALLSRHASVRSVWVRNSARGAVAVAAAVTVADLTNVQHGFWIVLGTLSVLRTTATATGGTALRALLGTTIGFLVGAAVILAVGTDTSVLWVVLPLAVLIASYAPGVAPFAVGQAAFTAMLLVLYNLLLPVGWKVGVVRVEDIAVGCGISLVVGVLFWPRGATAVVADDLDDAFTTSAGYLVDSSEWALGLGGDASHSGRSALVTGLRLEDALRAFLNEQGAKLLPKEDLWALVGAAQRLRLTAAALAELPAAPTTGPIAEALRDRARALGAWYASVATHIRLGQPPRLVALAPGAALDSASITNGHQRACQITVDQHLRHLLLHHGEVIDPATRLAVAAKRPWWHPVSPATPTPAAPTPTPPPPMASSRAGPTEHDPGAEGGL
jgi:uncharacterized membrane protein YccC